MPSNNINLSHRWPISNITKQYTVYIIVYICCHTDSRWFLQLRGSLSKVEQSCVSQTQALPAPLVHGMMSPQTSYDLVLRNPPNSSFKGPCPLAAFHALFTKILLKYHVFCHLNMLGRLKETLAVSVWKYN